MAAVGKRTRAKKRASDVSMDEVMNNESDSEEDQPVKKDKFFSSNSTKNELKRHKQDLKKLEKTDPEFYKYLEANDKSLLDFDASSDDDSDGEPDVHNIEESKLELASDDSEAEDDEAPTKVDGNRQIVNQAMINKWTENLRAEEVSMDLLQEIIEVFAAAVEQAEGVTNSENKFKVSSSITFNGIMRMCVVDLPPALKRQLRVKDVDNLSSLTKCKKWPKIQTLVKKYLNHLHKVLSVVSEAEVTSVFLKHVYQMIPFIVAISRHSKGFLKRLVVVWSTADDESVRVLAFLSIVNITQKVDYTQQEFVLKSMYMSFVKNVKFTSPTTWPLINFMKRCLVELLALNERLAYQYAFVYIRQLAIHLRNALTVPKKDSIHAVYNWQFIHCLGLWSQMLSSLGHLSTLQPLLYPLVQTIIGTIRLVPTAKYYPLRFHCVRSLTQLCKQLGCFIPILPLLTEVLELTDFNTKSHRQSWKPLNFMCMLKLSKSQLAESGFKDSLMDQWYELMMDYLAAVSHQIGFPELVLPTVLQMKTFVKRCQIANYCKQVKTLQDKIEENSRHIVERRNMTSIKLADTKLINGWETETKLKETPLTKYYVIYRRLRDREILHEITNKEKMESSMELPTVKRRELMDKHKAKDRNDFNQLFADDADDQLFSKKEVKSDDECSDLTSLSSSDEEDEEGQLDDDQSQEEEDESNDDE